MGTTLRILGLVEVVVVVVVAIVRALVVRFTPIARSQSSGKLPPAFVQEKAEAARATPGSACLSLEGSVCAVERGRSDNGGSGLEPGIRAFIPPIVFLVPLAFAIHVISLTQLLHGNGRSM